MPAGATIGKYTVRSRLAEGGMAELYLCSALGPEGFAKDVVIKRVRPHLAKDPVFIEMFIAEARLASRLNHRNVIQIFDFDRHEDTHYLAMEYVRGASLWELRRRCRERCIGIPPVLAAYIGAEVAHGLAYAHRLTDRGRPLEVVHRDVTPHNILLAFEGAVKLTDFGIARAGSSATAPGVLKGKYAYMSPEQARGEVVDARTDIFALGIVVWEMLTGARLFEGDSDLAVLRAVQRREIPPPARLNPDVPESLDAIVMRALERDAGRRYASASELARALSQVVLQHARSFDDTDVGAFLRHVVGDAEGGGAPVTVDLTSLPAPAPEPGGGSRHEPTAVMPGRGPRPPPPRERPEREPREQPPPDDEAQGTTLVLVRSPGAPRPRAGAGPREDLAAGPQEVERGGAPPDVRGGDAPLGSRGSSGPVGEGRGLAATAALVLLALVATAGVLWAGQAPPEPSGDSPHVPRSLPPSTPRSSPPQVRPALMPHAERAGAPARAATLPPEVAAPPDGTSSPGLTGGADGGGTAPALSATLEPQPARAGSAPAGHEVGPAAGAASLRQGGTDSSVGAGARRRAGVLVLKVFPVAQVLVDGRDLGEVSGSRSLSLPAGEHRVVFQHRHRTQSVAVTVSAARPTELEFNAFKVQ